MGKLLILSAATLLSGSILLAADDAMTPPAGDAPAAVKHRAKIVKPYSDLGDLTDDQKAKIENAHATYLEGEKLLLAKERADIEAILTDDQKTQLKTIEESAATARKEKAAEKKKEKADGDATTQPAQ